MAKKKKRSRIDTTGAGEQLPDDRFAALAELSTQLPDRAMTEDTTAAQVHPFSVARSRKGGFHVSIERRSAGKVVTVVHNVEGDGRQLLKALRRLCGSGGTTRDDTVEIQGDHQQKVKDYLEELFSRN